MHNIKTNSHDKILSIEYPKEGKLRVRKVVSRARARATGKYPSWKMGRMIEWESNNELNAYRLLDANPLVAAFYEQPVVIRYSLDATERLHFPDVLVETNNARELWEIKDVKDASQPDCVARTQFMINSLPSHGFTYRLVLASDLLQQPRLSNSLLLLKYGRSAISPMEREQIRQLFKINNHITWDSTGNILFGNRSRFLLARLALEGYLSFDIERPLNSSTVFTQRRDL